MQFTTSTLIALLSVVSLTMAAPAPAPAPAPHNDSYKPNSPTVNNEAATANQGPTIQARIQFELERQTTFIQRQFPVGAGPIPINLATVFSAFIVSVEGIVTGEDVNTSVVCQGLDAQGRAVGAPIHEDADNADLNGGEAVAIAAVECVQA